jgi:hypothetical protein
MGYEWRLEVPVSTGGRQPEKVEECLRPRLLLVRRPGTRKQVEQVLSHIEYGPGEWLAPSVSWVSYSHSGGAAERQSSDSASSALDVLMDLAEGGIGSSNRTALTEIARLLLPVLEQTVDALVRRPVAP